MTIPGGWIVAGAVLALALGLVLMLAGRGIRLRRDLGGGKTVSLDRVTLTSRRLGLTGRPHRLVKSGRHDHPRSMEFMDVMHLVPRVGDEQEAPIARLRRGRR